MEALGSGSPLLVIVKLVEMKKISKDEAVDDEDAKENVLQVNELEKVKEATKMAIETLKQI